MFRGPSWIRSCLFCSPFGSTVSLVDTECVSCLEPMTRFAPNGGEEGGRRPHRKLLPCLPLQLQGVRPLTGRGTCPLCSFQDGPPITRPTLLPAVAKAADRLGQVLFESSYTGCGLEAGRAVTPSRRQQQVPGIAMPRSNQPS
ncbi:hypothetical protein V8F06_004418 [Rhypophila decipiens]